MSKKRIINVLVILVVFAGLAMAFQDKLIFFPGAWPANFNLPDKLKSCNLTGVSLKTTDNISLDAVFAQTTAAAKNGKTILFSHGNAGNLLHRVGKIDKMCEAGFDVLIYDYRGFGRSTGTPTVAGAIIDGKTALQWLLSEKKLKPDKIVLYGESLGTGVAAEILRDTKTSFAAMVLESGFASLGAQASRRIPLIGRYILKKDLPTSETIKNYHGRLLLIHSRKDGIIPYSDGELVFASCPSDYKTMYTIETAGHNDPVWDDPAWLQTWLKLSGELE
ncbi:MAG: alpha/beta hydrolase [Candidatus Riflebacteria bacterium]|nr:alpha/beta hydrolase [Candidatus Riflebacteria bacterium]